MSVLNNSVSVNSRTP